MAVIWKIISYLGPWMLDQWPEGVFWWRKPDRMQYIRLIWKTKCKHLSCRKMRINASEVSSNLHMQGILSPADAEKAVENGCDGIIVSNHGGRQLDYTPASLDMLPAIAEAVNRRVPIWLVHCLTFSHWCESKLVCLRLRLPVYSSFYYDRGTTPLQDGGVRRGTDIIKVNSKSDKFDVSQTFVSIQQDHPTRQKCLTEILVSTASLCRSAKSNRIKLLMNRQFCVNRFLKGAAISHIAHSLSSQ